MGQLEQEAVAPDEALDHDDHGGLQRDLPRLLGRREALMWMGGASLAGLMAACRAATDSATTLAPATSVASTTSTVPAATTPVRADSTTTTALQATIEATAGPEIPDEGAGPFPADGTNGPNALTENGVFKRDIASSFGDLSGTAAGIPLTIHLAVVEATTGEALPGAAVYLWHCTAQGQYSIYEIPDQNFLRGLQVGDDAGLVSFATVFPGCYPGRWPHAHLEVYKSLDEASVGSEAIKTSQLALPRADCEVVYADPAYGASAEYLSRLSLDTDFIFRDGWTDQLATVTGSPDVGYTAALLVRV